MEYGEIIGLCVSIPSLIILLVLLWYICIKLTNTEKVERETKTKLYKELTNYLKIKTKIEFTEEEKNVINCVMNREQHLYIVNHNGNINDIIESIINKVTK